jgi:hypothetical protein
MSRSGCFCPHCGAEVIILSSKEEDNFKVVCPKCFKSFYVVNVKTGLPGGDRYELDPRHIL